MARVHDMAGRSAGAIDQARHPRTEFDQKVNALVRLLMDPGVEVIYVDQLRRAVEDVGDDAYFDLTYYERWLEAARVLLVERGVLTEEEISARVAKIRAELEMSGHA